MPAETLNKLTPMGKEKIRLEYMLKAGSGNVVWSIISTPSGLETWFADKITFKDKVFTFKWGKTESREAEVVSYGFIGWMMKSRKLTSN